MSPTAAGRSCSGGSLVVLRARDFRRGRGRRARAARAPGHRVLRGPLRVPDATRKEDGLAGPLGRVRAPGPGRLHLGRHRRRPVPLRREPLPQVRPPRRPARGCGSTSSTRPPDGRLYVATAAGLARFATASSSSSTRRTASASFSIPHQGIASDASGTLYVGTDRGLYVGRGDRFEFDAEANARRAAGR